jgi:hypothetical protein
MIKLLLPALAVFLVALTAVPGVLIKRSRSHDAVEAVASFRDTLAPAAALDPEQAALDARWATYWAAVDDEWMCSDLRAWILSPEEPVAEPELPNPSMIMTERFPADPGRLANAIEREAERLYQLAHGNLTRLKHLVEIELTDTRWTSYDTILLNEYIAEQDALKATVGAARGGRRRRVD